MAFPPGHLAGTVEVRRVLETSCHLPRIGRDCHFSCPHCIFPSTAHPSCATATLLADTEPQQGLAHKLPAGAGMKSSLGGVRLPCCLQALCSPLWCRDGSPALGANPSPCVRAELAAAQGSSLQCRGEQRGLVCWSLQAQLCAFPILWVPSLLQQLLLLPLQVFPHFCSPDRLGTTASAMSWASS